MEIQRFLGSKIGAWNLFGGVKRLVFVGILIRPISDTCLSASKSKEKMSLAW